MVNKMVAAAALGAFLAVPVGAAHADDAPAVASESGIVRVTGCPPGYTGYVVEAWNEKRGWYEVTSFCIPWGP